MSIWGKILGGAAGFAVGGPIGALLGAIAGHAVDQYRDSELIPTDATRQVTFTIAVIVLSAKMAKADGVVTKDEIAAFRRVFQIPAHEAKNVGRVFDMARADSAGFEPYAEQVARLFHGHPEVLEDLLGALFHIALADGSLHARELDFLKRIAEIFGFSEGDFDRIKSIHAGPDAADPYTVLGIAHDASDKEIKSAYRKLIRENHPDKLIAEGLPQEFVDVANEKMKAINVAYDKVAKQRGLT
jgi:DnaJ like chaperone protein